MAPIKVDLVRRTCYSWIPCLAGLGTFLSWSILLIWKSSGLLQTQAIGYPNWLGCGSYYLSKVGPAGCLLVGPGLCMEWLLVHALSGAGLVYNRAGPINKSCRPRLWDCWAPIAAWTFWPNGTFKSLGRWFEPTWFSSHIWMILGSNTSSSCPHIADLVAVRLTSFWLTLFFGIVNDIL